LTTGIAHDFNNILTVVIGNIELARLSTDPAEIDESLAEAHRTADRAGSLVAQLPACSRRAQFRPVTIAPLPFFHRFANTMQRLLPASITFSHQVYPGLPPFHCDRALLETALLNLVINARDAIDGRGHLSLVVNALHLSATRALRCYDLPPGHYICIH